MTKSRVQVDALVIGSFMIVTIVLVFVFPFLYNDNEIVRDICSIFGFMLIVFGALLRMSARGYKKFCSNQGFALVTEGPYKFVRNPMYLGTFLIGVGFICPLLPLWTIVIFATIFYFRFIIQIRKEEAALSEKFEVAYRDYCKKVPAFIPTLKSFKNVKFREVFSRKHLWTTKEKFSLFYWPVLNLFLWLIQQEMFWREYSLFPVFADAIFALGLLIWMIASAHEEDRWIIPEKS